MLAGADLDAYTPVLAAGFDTGYSATDGITNIGAPTIEINLGAVTINSGDYLQIAGLPGGPYQVPAPAFGANQFLIPALGDGTYSVTVEMLDSTNAAGQPSQALTLVIDTVAPEVTSIVVPPAAVYGPLGGSAPSTLLYDVRFNEEITTYDAPRSNGVSVANVRLPIAIGTDPASNPDVQRWARLSSNIPGSDKASNAEFQYVIQAADPIDANGVRVGDLMSLLAGAGPHSLDVTAVDTIFDLAGNAANTSIRPVVVTNSNVQASFSVFVNTASGVVASFVDFDNPRVTPLPTITIEFKDLAGNYVPRNFVNPNPPPTSVPFYGTGVITLEDFRLTRNGEVISLATNPPTNPPGQNLSAVVLTTPLSGPGTSAVFQLAGLEDRTNLPGTYTLTFSDLGVSESATVSWSKDYTTPAELRATLTASPDPLVKDGITEGPIDSVTVRFTDAAGAINGVYDAPTATTPGDLIVPVTGVIKRPTAGNQDPRQFALYRDGEKVDDFYKSPVTISGSGNTYTITGLSSLTSLEGAYELVLWDRDPTTGLWNGISSLFDEDTSGKTPTDTPPSSALKAPESIKWQNIQRPTVTITSSSLALREGQSATITFSLSKPSVTFTSASVTTSGGQLANFRRDPNNELIYTAIFTADVATPVAGGVTVAAGAVSDTTGNPNANPATVSIALNTTAPTVTITSSLAAMNLDQTATITFVLSGASDNFEARDVTVSGGTLSGFTGSGATFTAVFFPSAGQTLGLISVAAGTFTDRHDTPNLAGAISQAISIDSIAPTVSINSNLDPLGPGQRAILTFTLSEASAATSTFAAQDVVVTGGAIANFTQVSPTVYTAELTPAANASVVVVAIPAGAFADAAGNLSTAAGTRTIKIDEGAPVVTAVATASSNSAEIYRVRETIPFTVTFSEIVEVVGNPTLEVYIGTGTTEQLRSATYAAGNGTNTLVFHYTVAATDTNDVDGVRVQGLVVPAGASIKDVSGNDASLAIAAPVVAGNLFVVTATSSAPSFSLLPNPLSNPRATPVSVIRVTFDQPVPFVATGANGVVGSDVPGLLSLNDFELVRNGGVVPFPTGARLIQSGTTFREFDISNLSDLTEPVGTYILTFADLRIADRVTTTWIKSVSTPGELTASISLAPTAASPRRIPVDTATVAFSRTVVNVDLADFVFRKDGVIVLWSSTGAVLSGSGDSYVLSNLTALTDDPGSTYEITLVADEQLTQAVESDIVTLADGKLISPVSARWTFEPPVAITSVAPVSLPPSGFFRVGDVIEFDVTFTEPVFVTNPQFITLPIFLGTGTAGGPNNTVQAAYVSGDATNTLRFRYLPLPTDQDLDGILLSGSLSLGTGTSLGTIRDSAGIDAVLSYTQPNTTLLRIDSRAPQITGVTGPANGTYGVGDALVFQVTFDESVVVSGTPRIPLVIGIQTVYADIIAGQETPTLIFQYVIQSGDNDTDGIIASSQIALNGGAVGDIAGNPALLTFAPLNLSGVRIDTAPPPAPVILGVFADNSGADLLVPDGGSTSDNALKLSGTAEPASVVTVFVNDVAYGQVTTPATGLWEFTTFTLASVLPTGNQYLFTAQAKDALNNIGPVSASYTVFVDTTPPSAPSVNPLITLNPRPTLTGAAVLLAGEILTVTISGEDGFVSFAYPVVPDDNGGWSLDLSTAVPVFSALAEGTYAVTATATDAAGNFTTDPTTSELVVDTSPVTVDVLQTNNPQPLITGTAVVPTGGRLEVTVNGQTYVVPVTSEGVWQLNLATAVPAFTPLADGIYSVTATVYDPSGTSLSDPTTDELQIDTTGPVVLAVDSLTPDGSYRAGDRINIQVTFADDVVVETTFGLPRLALNTGRTAVYVPEASNARVLTFSYVVQAGDNTDDLDYPTIAALSPNGATIRDGAGNDAELTLPIPGGPNSLGFNRSITIDTTPPSPPPTVDPLTTNNPLPTITGSAVLDTGDLLTVTVSGTTFPVFPNADGRWTLDLSLANPLPDSPPLQPLAAGLRYNVIAAITDAAGNSTTDQTSNELAINSFAPLILGAIDDVQPGVGVLPSGRATNDPTPTLVGSANPDFLITISVETSSDGASSAFPIGTTISDSQGNWSFTPTSDLADGDYTFLIESTAAAGGTSIKGVVPFLLRVDTQQPTIAGITVAPKIYRAGDTIPITVSFNEAVRVSGKPELTFTIGTETETVTRIATYATGNGTSTLVFTYNIQATDLNDVDGVVVNSVSLPTSDATIRDAAANDADLAIANTTLAGDVFLMPRTATPSFTLFPTVRVNPRATPVSVVRLSFDNPVPYVLNASGTDGEDAVALLSLADFELTHNGNLVAFPPEARLIQSSSGTDFEISNLSAVTETVGTYILTFADRQIGPHQAYTWTKTDVTPAEVTAAITLTSSGGPLAPVDSATIVFSENVDNVDLSDFELRRDGAVLPWTGSGIVLSAADAGATYRLTGLEALTGVNGVYQLTLLADNQSTPQQESDIVSYTGGQLIGSVSRSWSFTRSVQIAANGITASVPPASGIFSKGDALVFTVRFTEPVYSSATADLNMPLTIGNRIVPATYISGDGSDTITFAYLVQPGDSDLDGITLQGTLNLGSGTLRNAQGRDASVVFTPPNTTGLLVDGIDPTLDRVVLAANRGLYSTGQILRFTATFSEPMRVAGEPRIVLTVGTAKRYATYVTGDQTNVLVFEYQVQAGDDAPGGIVAASYISRNKGAVTDLAGNACDLNFTPLDLTGVRIDNGPPTVTGVATTVADGHYKAGDVIPLTVSVSETVIAGSSLTLVLDTGANILVVAEAAGTQLMGRYTVRAGDSSSRLDVTALSNPSVRDLGGTPMTATEFPSTIHKLAGTRAIVIDTTAPVAPSVTPLATSNRLPVLQGTAYPAAGETLRVEVAGLVFSNVPVDLLGRWSVNLATLQPSIGTALPLADGPYTVTAQLLDLAGNAGSGSAVLSIDTIPTVASAAGWGNSLANPPRLPRSSNIVTIVFNEPVTGFTTNDVRLFYEGRSVSIAGAALTGSGTTYTLSLPTRALALAGLYRLDIGGVGTGIRDSNLAVMSSASSLYAYLF